MPKFPKFDRSVAELIPIAESWRFSSSLHDWKSGADESAISQVETTLGRRLPAALRAIYKMSDGLSLLSGNLQFEALRPTESSFGLVNYSDQLREYEWPIPEELIMFGGNGSDELFGVWLPVGREHDRASPIIEVGEIFESRSFAIVGTDLCKFLRTWTAYYTMLTLGDEDPRALRKALDSLKVPETLRRTDPDDDVMRELFRWSDPSLPDYFPDPYERGLTAEQIRLSYGANQK